MKNRSRLTIFSLIISSCYVIFIFVNRGPSLHSMEGNKSFSAQLASFPWDNFTEAIDFNETEKIQTFCSLLFRTLLPFLIESPLTPINSSCFPPPLRLPPKLKCERLGRARKVGVLLQFGFDVDALELHLHELDGVADKFFLIEWIQSHSSFVRMKPLLWDRLKGEERFAKFLGKIVHFVVDDAELAENRTSHGIWEREKLQEELRWSKFLQWNNNTNYFRDDDLLGFGDTDEVPHRDNIYFLKHCALPSDPVDIGIWYPFGGLNTIFKTDQPIPSHPFTLGDPTYWTLSTAKLYQRQNGLPPNRMRGSSEGYLLGGIHLSRYSYLPFRLAKLLSATEAELSNLDLIIELGRLVGEGEAGLYLGLAGLNRADDRMWKEKRLLNLTSFDETDKERIVKLPWFYECNEDRYPALRRRLDPRLN